MKAMILAAGRGTRVRPLTERLPKPMIPIVHKPVMTLLVEHLKRHGFDEIMVNTSFMAPEIENYFRDGNQFGVRMAYSFEGVLEDGKLVDQPIGSAGALQKIQTHSGFFDEDFLVICGDAIIDLDLAKMMAFHRSRGALATVALKKVPREELPSYGVAVLADDQRIVSFQEKPAPGTELSDLANTGIYIFSPKVFDWIPRDVVYDIGGQLLPALAAAGEAMYGIELPFEWLDIGKLPDFHAVVMRALRGEVDLGGFPGREVKPGVWAGLNVRANFDALDIKGPVYIGGSAAIEDGSVIIGPALIGANARIESGAHIESTIVLDHTRVGGFTHCVRRVVGPGFSFDPAGTVVDGGASDVDWLFADSRTRAPELDDGRRELQESLREHGYQASSQDASKSG
ncbi:MAG: hypothetical protein RLZZ200_2565 [Pseudomonadota bacterium]|jgi:mannose-1-phosphate guanylyltransferase